MELDEPSATSSTDATDYQLLFRMLLMRSVAKVLATMDLQVPRLDDEERERSLYALSLALNLAEAWPDVRDLLSAIAPHMEMQGYRSEWEDFLEKGLAIAVNQGDTRAAAQFHLHLGRLAHLVNDYTKAEEHLNRACQDAEALGYRTVLLGAIDRRAIVAVEQSDFIKTRALVHQALSLMTPDDPASAPSYHMLGFLALRQGEWEAAIGHYRHALELRTKEGERRAVALAIRDLALAFMYSERFDEARQQFNTAIAMFGEQSAIYDQALAQMDLGIVHWYSGQWEHALECYAACEPVFVKTGSKLSLTRLHNNRGLTYDSMNRYAEALQSFATSVEIAREVGSTWDLANVLESAGSLLRKMGNAKEALNTWRSAVQELECLPERPQGLYDQLQRQIQEIEEAAGG
jgi:tetratricopeptide (TPR) repeat protein